MSTIRNTGSVRTTAPTTSTRAPTSPQPAPTAQQPAATGHSSESSFQAAAAPPELTREEKKQILSDAFGQLREKIEERYKKDGSYRTKKEAEKQISKFEEEILSGKKPLNEETLKKGLTDIFNVSGIMGRSRDATWKAMFNQILEQFQKPRNWD